MFTGFALSWLGFLAPRVTKNRLIISLALQNVVLVVLFLNPRLPDVNSRSRSIHAPNLEECAASEIQEMNVSSARLYAGSVLDIFALSWLSFLVPVVTINRMMVLLAIENMILVLPCLTAGLSYVKSRSKRSLHEQNLEENGTPERKPVEVSSSLVLESDSGDPVIFQPYWMMHAIDNSVVIPSWRSISYRSSNGPFVFKEDSLDRAIRSLHKLVGNAVVDDRHIVIGAGSAQLLHAAFYALASSQKSAPLKVISAAPFFSLYPAAADLLQSNLYEWGGDALEFDSASWPDGYIEIVNYPNNPDGTIRNAVVNGSGQLLHDLAYYWPHYTPITSPSDHDIMLFTFSKITGHAGSRLGWAIVKDLKVAQLMFKFTMINTLGVSRDVQFRGAHLLRNIVHNYTLKGSAPYILQNDPDKSRLLFHNARNVLEQRWKEIRDVVSSGNRFILVDYPTAFCNFLGRATTTCPAFAWLKCEKDLHCEELLKSANILGRGAEKFGVADTRHVRLSMMHTQEEFKELITRLALLNNSSGRQA